MCTNQQFLGQLCFGHVHMRVHIYIIRRGNDNQQYFENSEGISSSSSPVLATSTPERISSSSADEPTSSSGSSSDFTTLPSSSSRSLTNATTIITSSTSEAAPYCVPFQDPGQGIEGYCQCSDGADFSFAPEDKVCPYISPGPASLSIDKATITGTVTEPTNPVPPITVVSSAASTSDPTPTPSSDPLAEQCGIATPPVCETSDGSPEIEDCSSFDLTTPQQFCGQSTGSGCQTHSKFGTYKLVFCQPNDLSDVFDDTRKCLMNNDSCMSYWVDQLIDTCGHDGKVGGYITIPLPKGEYLNLEFTR